jgi:malonate-semialdehyde dehydrogenase (acetylating)/methylmalonate-semialdehyde dehydrogenase
MASLEDVPLISHWISGQQWDGVSSSRMAVYNPATGEVTKAVPRGGEREVDQAVQAALQAFSSWRDVSIARRTKVLFRFRELVSSRASELAAAIVREHGKTMDDAIAEVGRGLEVVEFACGLGQILKSEFSENVSSDVDTYSIRQPLGVVAGITPFNFPVMVPMWMFPIAIATGNCFILKPSEKDPSPSLLLAEMWTEAGLPDGVFNVIQGSREAVDAILNHPNIAAISFVGSTPVAKHVFETAAGNGKRVQALGGAKNHMVVLPDADLDQAADAAVSAAYGSAGERCMAISVVVAVGDMADSLVDAIASRCRQLVVGPGDDPASQMGPLVTQEHLNRVVALVEKGIAEGAKLVVDGRSLKVTGHEGGFFLGPCLFDYVEPNMTIYKEEIFGPVLCVVRKSNLQEAVEFINANPYGNGAAIFTSDGEAARRFQHEIQAGMIGINIPIPTPVAYHSFGGWKHSLFGDTYMHGMQGIHFYTRAKTVTARWRSSRGAVNLGFPIHA